MDNAAAAGAGHARWDNNGGECGAARVGNNDLMGGRRRRSRSRSSRRRTLKRGGGGTLALQQPISSYGYKGNASAGLTNADSNAPYTTYV